jgi:fructose-1,6-bisphosphatase II
MMPLAPDRNVSLDLVRVTEAAALAAGRHMGLGDPAEGERVASEAMRVMLQSVDMDGTVVIGQVGESGTPGLWRGQRVGSGAPPAMDVALDPVEGVDLLTSGRANALSVIAAAERGTLFDPEAAAYMDKIAVGPAAASVIDITAPVERNLRAIARANRKDLDDLTIVVLDRPRHAGLVEEIRATGARIRLISHGDVAGAIMTCVEETGIDALFGIGGAPEGVIAACALKCLGGAIQVRLVPAEALARASGAGAIGSDSGASGAGAAAGLAGVDADRVYGTEDLVASDNVFFSATGITNGELLRGVHYHGAGARTFSVTMRSRSGTIRMVESRHRWDKLMGISRVAYDTR